jgi:Ribosomal L30 N-terminal domain
MGNLPATDHNSHRMCTQHASQFLSRFPFEVYAFLTRHGELPPLRADCRSADHWLTQTSRACPRTGGRRILHTLLGRPIQLNCSQDNGIVLFLCARDTMAKAQVPESLLKKRQRDEAWATKKASAAAEAKTKAKSNRKLIFKKAEVYVKEYRQQVRGRAASLRSTRSLTERQHRAYSPPCCMIWLVTSAVSLACEIAARENKLFSRSTVCPRRSCSLVPSIQTKRGQQHALEHRYWARLEVALRLGQRAASSQSASN